MYDIFNFVEKFKILESLALDITWWDKIISHFPFDKIRLVPRVVQIFTLGVKRIFVGSEREIILPRPVYYILIFFAKFKILESLDYVFHCLFYLLHNLLLSKV